MVEDVAIVGRKTFFIAPDGVLIPDSCLERLMSHGYEAYGLSDISASILKKKVEDVIRLFPGCILFFNIDSTLAGIDWKSYIKDLCARHRSSEKIGIVLKALPSAADSYQIESYYQNDARINAGILALKGNASEDFERILETLAGAGGRGRRKIVRADGNAGCSVVFPHATAQLKDISRAYFCCVFEEALEARVYDRFNRVDVHFNGLHFTSDAVLVMKHSRGGMNCGIFMFVKEDGSPELEPAVKGQLNKKIYDMISAERKEALESAFTS